MNNVSGPQSSSPIGSEYNKLYGNPVSSKTSSTQSAPPISSTNEFSLAQPILQQFSSRQGWGMTGYPASLDQPVLEMPDPNGGTLPTPFPTSSQAAVNKYFTNLVTEAVLKRRAESSESEGRVEAFIPNKQGNGEGVDESFEESDQGASGLANEKRKTETIPPRLVPPGVLKEVNKVIGTVLAGKAQDLSPEDQAVVNEATEKTREAWSLPSSWNMGTTKSADWTPVQVDVVPPVDMNTSRCEVLLQGVEITGKTIQDVGNQLLASMPKDDPDRIAMSDTMRIIMKALNDLREVLQLIQLEDSKRSDDLAKAKNDQLTDRFAQLQKNIDQQKKIAKEKAKANKKQKQMHVIGFAVSIVVIAIALVITAVTFGLGSPILIAAIAVSTVMLGYTVADYKLHLTEKAMTGFNNSLEQAIPDENLRMAVKVMILAVLVLVLLVLTEGSAGASMGSQAATQTTKEVAIEATKESLKQVALQSTIMFIMASNIVPELATFSLVKAGLVDKDNQEALMIIQMIFMIATMLCVMAAVSGGGAQAAAESEAGAAAAAAESSKAATTSISESIKQSAVQTAQSIKNSWARLMETTLDDIKKLLLDTALYIPRRTQDFINGALSLLDPTALARALAKVSTRGLISGVDEAASDTAKVLQQLQDLTKMMGYGVEAAGSIYLGSLGLIVADTLKKLGEGEKAAEIALQMIKLFERMLQNLQESTAAKMSWIDDLNKAIDAAYSAGMRNIGQAGEISLAS